MVMVQLMLQHHINHVDMERRKMAKGEVVVAEMVAALVAEAVERQL